MSEGSPEGLGRSRPQLNVPVERLKPDPQNPRLSPKHQNKSEQETLQIMLKEFNLLELGLSMVRNGYFDAEPLVIVPENLPDEFKQLEYSALNTNESYKSFINDESTQFIVVEGNRRISTVKLLLEGSTSRLPEITREDVRQDLSVLPCIVYPKRSDVLAYIGARHIIGIKKWNSFAKARYIAHLKEELGKSMDEIQNTLGDTTQSVRKVYAAYLLVKHVEEEFGEDANDMKKDFSFLILSLGQVSIKSYLKISDNWRHINFNTPLINSSNEGNLRYLKKWLYGEVEESKRVISESRDITKKLTPILADEDAKEYLEQTNDLAGAFDRCGGEERLLRSYLIKANKECQNALGLIANHSGEDINTEIKRLYNTVQLLMKLINDPQLRN